MNRDWLFYGNVHGLSISNDVVFIKLFTKIILIKKEV